MSNNHVSWKTPDHDIEPGSVIFCGNHYYMVFKRESWMDELYLLNLGTGQVCPFNVNDPGWTLIPKGTEVTLTLG